MTIDEMIAPGAHVDTSRANMLKLIEHIREQRNESNVEAMAFYAFVAALVLKAGGEVTLEPELQERAKACAMEVADLPDGSQVVRIAQEAKPAAVVAEAPRPALILPPGVH